MSATRDPSQKHTFVYSNLYQLYQKGKTAAKAADVPAPESKVAPIAPTVASVKAIAVAPARESQDTSGIVSGKIIKADEMNQVLNGQTPVGLRVARHEPPSLLGKRLGLSNSLNTVAPRAGRVDPARRQAIDGLRDNLRQLQSLHERLRFMLKEIEEFTNE